MKEKKDSTTSKCATVSFIFFFLVIEVILSIFRDFCECCSIRDNTEEDE
jgi:hypothetical protein